MMSDEGENEGKTAGILMNTFKKLRETPYIQANLSELI